MSEIYIFQHLTQYKIMAIYGLRPYSRGQTEYYSITDDCKKGDYALIESDQAPIIAKIITGPMTALPGSSEENLPGILRLANNDDLETYQKNEILRKEAQAFCKQCIRDRNLEMKLVDVEIFFDRSKFIFYFTAPGRIDFRELVKDLVREYRARIELRQIGVRHETQKLGAIGNCGLVCCCRGHLRKFAPVTIKMAKEQNLFLNPSKISGICGRLLCCLAYEQDNYEDYHRTFPRTGKKYLTEQGTLKVLHTNMFKNTVTTLNEANVEVEMNIDQWNALKPRKASPDKQSKDEEIEENALPNFGNMDNMDELEN